LIFHYCTYSIPLAYRNQPLSASPRFSLDNRTLTRGG
jgi:hypothetical protein